MSDKLKAMHFKADCFEAIYPGDTAYRAFRDAGGTVHVMELPSQDYVSLIGKMAAKLFADLEEVSEMHGYDDGQINAIHHWLLARAFKRAHPERESVPCLDRDAWPVTVSREAA